MNYRLALFSLLLLPYRGINQRIVVRTDYLFSEAPFQECHASTIEETKEGLVAAWFGGSKEGNWDVEIWITREINGRWTYPVSVANGIQHDKKRYPCWNPVLFQAPDNNLMLFYKVGPSPSKWWGEVKISKDCGKTWSDAQRLPEDILGPVKNKPVLLNDGRLICASSTEVGPNTGWRIHFEVTKDFGKTWRYVGPIDTASVYNAIQPSILHHGGDTIQLLARSKDDGIITGWSYDNGMNWAPLQVTGLPNPNSGIDAVTLKNGWQLLVYNRSGKIANKWTGKRTPLNVAISKDGINWKDILVLEDQPGEYSYPAVIQSKDGHIHITYTWNRRKIKYAELDLSKMILEHN